MMTNTSSPTVSVVMPTHNRADLLTKTTESILNQDFEDLELLIVDDGSTDNTAAVIKEIQDPRLRYVKLPENRGIGFARQAGLQHVSGKYIALADSDDLWLPGKLAAQIDVLDEHPGIDILFSDFINIDYVAGKKGNGFSETRSGMKHLTVRHITDDLWLICSGVETGILKSNFIAAPTMVLRADVFDRVGSFDPTLMSVDFEFGWRAAVLGARYAYLNRPYIERYRYPSSATAHRIKATLEKLDALRACHRTCAVLQCRDLDNQIRAAEQKTRRKLLWLYGGDGQRAEAVSAFRESLQSGLTVRNLVVCLAALLGPKAVSAALWSAKKVRATDL
jgi:glycosyltransferase involved in cell wall biosynthesis